MRLRYMPSLLIVAAALMIARSSAWGQAGSAGLAYLKMGVTGSGVAMGDALTASAEGVAGTYYNPAGVAAPCSTCGTTQFLFTHKEWIQDTRMEFLGATVRLGEKQAIGFSLNTTTTSDIEIRTQPGPADGTFTARDFSLGVSYGRTMWSDLRLGATLKYLYEKILIDEAQGFAFDLGAQYTTPVEHMTVGMLLANIGSMKNFRSSSLTLPALIRIGPAYGIPIEGLNAEATIEADYERVFPESRSYFNTGGEMFFNNIVAARLGYQFGSEGRGFSAGIGVRYGVMILDYAYAPVSQDLGNTHTITLGVNL